MIGSTKKFVKCEDINCVKDRVEDIQKVAQSCASLQFLWIRRSANRAADWVTKAQLKGLIYGD